MSKDTLPRTALTMKICSDKMWAASAVPVNSWEYVDATEDPYSNGVKLEFGGVFNVTLTPDEALWLADRLAGIGHYLQIFQARYGIEDRDAKVSREER